MEKLTHKENLMSCPYRWRAGSLRASAGHNTHIVTIHPLFLQSIKVCEQCTCTIYIIDMADPVMVIHPFMVHTIRPSTCTVIVHRFTVTVHSGQNYFFVWYNIFKSMFMAIHSLGKMSVKYNNKVYE